MHETAASESSDSLLDRQEEEEDEGGVTLWGGGGGERSGWTTVARALAAGGSMPQNQVFYNCSLPAGDTNTTIYKRVDGCTNSGRRAENRKTPCTFFCFFFRFSLSNLDVGRRAVL